MFLSGSIVSDAQQGRFDHVPPWLQQKPRPNADAINAVLREAARADEADVVDLLLQQKEANPYSTSVTGRMAFNYAAGTGLRALDRLVRAAIDDVRQPYAERRWKYHGADFSMNAPFGPFRANLFSYAVKACDADYIRPLIKEADLRATDKDGWNLLHKAAVMPDRAEVIRDLVRAMHDAGILEELLHAPTLKTHTATYDCDVRVHYKAGMTPENLYWHRKRYDPHFPDSMTRYDRLLRKPPHQRRSWADERDGGDFSRA